MPLQPNCRHLLIRLQIKLLMENNAHAALLHAFDGKPTYVLQGAQAGYYFSVPPSIVRSPQKQKVRLLGQVHVSLAAGRLSAGWCVHLMQMVAALPLDRLVLETDAPALGPDKDVPNVPANIVVSAREVARIKGLPVEQVVQITTENSCNSCDSCKVFLVKLPGPKPGSKKGRQLQRIPVVLQS